MGYPIQRSASWRGHVPRHRLSRYSLSRYGMLALFSLVAMCLLGYAGVIPALLDYNAGPPDYSDIYDEHAPPILLQAPEAAPGTYLRRMTALKAVNVSQVGNDTDATEIIRQQQPHRQPDPSLILRYASCGGLFNQHYCHVTAFAIGVALGVEGIIMPPAERRNKFAVDATQAKWFPADPSTIWDVPKLRRYAAGKGTTVHKVPTIFPGWASDGFGGFNPYGLTRRQVVRFPYMANELFTMEAFISAARDRIDAHLHFLQQGALPPNNKELRLQEVSGELLADLSPRVPHWAVRVQPATAKREAVWQLLDNFLFNETDAQAWVAEAWGIPLEHVANENGTFPYIPSDPQLKEDADLFQQRSRPRRLLLHLPCVLFGVRGLGSPLMSEVAANFDFSPRAYALSRKVIAGMARRSGAGGAQSHFFNGMHLRAEADAFRWIEMVGGSEKLWADYFAACEAAGFNSSTPVYVASGIFSNMTPQNRKRVARLGRTYSRRVFHKAQFLSKKDLAGLHSEQRALIDFLVMARANHFVGFVTSTFSVYVQQYRALHGFPAGATVMVDAPRMPEVSKEMMRLGGTFTRYPRQRRR